MMKKFELMTESKMNVFGKTLFRIRALVDFSFVKAGDVGGWIEEEGNLSQSGNAWVYGNAEVYGDARVYGDAEVCGNDDYTTIKGFGTCFRTTTFFRCKDKTVKVACGCFLGTIAEFRKQVKRTRSGKIAKEYLMIADLMEMHFKEGEDEQY